MPPHDAANEIAFKLNGLWFAGPREYFGRDRAGFEWWDHKAVRPRHQRPAALQAEAVAGNGGLYAIDIFLRSHDSLLHGPPRLVAVHQAEAEGRVISKAQPRPELEVWRTQEAGQLQPVNWYVARYEKEPGGEPPVLSCRETGSDLASCTTAFILQPGIAVDMRFQARHAPDWPEVYQEASRILRRLRSL